MLAAMIGMPRYFFCEWRKTNSREISTSEREVSVERLGRMRTSLKSSFRSCSIRMSELRTWQGGRRDCRETKRGKKAAGKAVCQEAEHSRRARLTQAPCSRQWKSQSLVYEADEHATMRPCVSPCSIRKAASGKPPRRSILLPPVTVMAGSPCCLTWTRSAISRGFMVTHRPMWHAVFSVFIRGYATWMP